LRLSDFLAKLMRLPLRFFDSKNVGGIMQRIGGDRIKSFFTGSSQVVMLFFYQHFTQKSDFFFQRGNIFFVLLNDSANVRLCIIAVVFVNNIGGFFAKYHRICFGK
jgi:ATP-binding cassette subfamily B protein